MNNQWVVSLALLPEPDMGEAPADIRDRAEALLSLWRHYVPAHEADGAGDFEDFFEQAARLSAAAETFGKTDCWLWLGKDPAINLESGHSRSKRELLDSGASDYGILHRWSRYETKWQRGDDVGDSYISSPTFQRHAGREVVVCGFAPDDPAALDLRDALVDFATRHRRALIKVGRAKHGFFWVDLPQGLTREGAEALMWEAMDMAPLNYEGRSSAFLLQAYATMRYEYRFFVVDGEVVTGAGCVEEFTPLNNQARFDNRMREVRLHEPSEVHAQPEVLARYLPFAQQVASEIKAEGFMDTFSLDVAEDENQRPLVIELNGLPNSGLYASDPRYVTQALLQNQ